MDCEIEFSQLYKHTNALCSWSPNTLYLATVVDKTLVIREVPSLKIYCTFLCPETIGYIEWSSDSLFVLCVLPQISRSTKVFSLEDPSWDCTINEGMAGVSSSKWTPDGRHILTISENNVKLNLWSLITQASYYIPNPKDLKDCVDFSSDDQFIAVATRYQYKDYITILYCDYWAEIKQFELETTDCSMIRFSPNIRCIAVADTVLQYTIYIYSLIGEKMAKYEPYKHSLGVRILSWSPSSEFLAIGSCDNKLRFLNHYTWTCITEIECVQTINTNTGKIYKEITREDIIQLKNELGDSIINLPTNRGNQFILVEPPLSLSQPIVPELTNLNPANKMGVSSCSWNVSGELIAYKCEAFPNCLYIYYIPTLTLYSVVVFLNNIMNYCWSPVDNTLVIVTGNNRLYIWNDNIMSFTDLPTDLRLRNAIWNANGRSLLVISKTKFCCCNFTDIKNVSDSYYNGETTETTNTTATTTTGRSSMMTESTVASESSGDRTTGSSSVY